MMNIRTSKVLILCTGFKAFDLGSLPITGAGGIDILQMWKLDRPKTFYGVTCAEAPNLFFLLGPNGVSRQLKRINASGQSEWLMWSYSLLL